MLGLRRWTVLAILLFGFGPRVAGAELKPATLDAFERYVRLTGQRVDRTLPEQEKFLWVDRQPQSAALHSRLRGGDVLVEKLETRDEQGREIEIPDGMVHHWMATVFIPGARLDQVLELVQSYDRHDRVYAPYVQRSKLLEHEGDLYRFYYRFYYHKVIDVYLDTRHEVRYQRLEDLRAASASRSTRIQEVEDAGQPTESLKPPGDDHGFLWRVNSFWRFQEREGGVFVQAETISLTRDIPFGLKWLVGPFVTDIPKESLEHTMRATRQALVRRP